jgi:hypothetical protein
MCRGQHQQRAAQDLALHVHHAAVGGHHEVHRLDERAPLLDEAQRVHELRRVRDDGQHDRRPRPALAQRLAQRVELGARELQHGQPRRERRALTDP